MKRINLIALALSLLTLVSGCSAAGPDKDTTEAPGNESGYLQISQEEAMRIMKEESGYVILDVRTESEFAEAHIPGAICIPVETIESLSEAPIEGLPDKDQTILVYCRSGRRSKIAAAKMADLGYSKVLEFGGIITWTGETVTD